MFDPMDNVALVEVRAGVVVRNTVDNMSWIDMGDYLLVVDTLEQPELESEVFDAIGHSFGAKPVRYVLNTHTHRDHVALNQAFKRRYGAEIVNAESRHIPEAGLVFGQAGGRQVIMIPAPGCHTDVDCLVWMPHDRVLFAGDLFGWGLIPWDANLRAEKRDLIVNTYLSMIALAPEIMVPGHGPVGSVDHLRRWLSYFQDLIEQARRLAAQGMDATLIQQQLASPGDMSDWWRFQQWKHLDSAKKTAKAAAHKYL